MRIVLIYQFFGPYHLARWRYWRHEATARGWTPLALQLFDKPDLYQWQTSEGEQAGFTNLGLKTAGNDQLRLVDLPILRKALIRLKPHVVIVNGWGTRDAALLHLLCRAKFLPRIVVSDSTESDFARSELTERIKKWLIHGSEAIFVAGSSHRRYAKKLGFDNSSIFEGCNGVDNAHFAQLNRQYQLKSNRILTVARFSPEKNLLAAGRAFLRFISNVPDCQRWRWLIVGYGPEEDVMRALAAQSKGYIQLLGAKSYQDLPAAYAAADLYWQPSLRDTWGLSVNEAMASGLPVLISQRCGCHEDLVTDKVGWTFNPLDEADMVRALTIAADARQQWPTMGQAAVEHIKKWGLQQFSDGLNNAVQHALAKRAVR